MVSLSLLSTGHPLSFQPKWVRPSTGSYPRFSLPMDRSPGFASAARDSCRPVRTRCRCGWLSCFASPRTATRWLILQKARRHGSCPLRLLVGARFQVLFHSPPGVLFTFPSRYLCAIGHRRVFRLGGWSPLLPTGFHVSGGTRGARLRGCLGFAYGAITLSRRPSHAVRLPSHFVTARGVIADPPRRSPHNPGGATPARCTLPPVWPWVPVRSPLLGESRLISLPRGT